MPVANRPFIPFARPTIDETMVSAVSDTLRSLWITSGPQVQAFEKALSVMHGDRPARVFTSATAALEVALLTIGVGPGDEVIMPAQTFFSCANAIRHTGATPVFVDVDPVTRNMDLTLARSAITPKTKVLMPTHFAGYPLDMDKLYALARETGLRVIEDAALAIGSKWQDKLIGSIGDIVSFSFHPNKNITTIEGGALIFSSEAEAKLSEAYRFHGISRLPDGTRDITVLGGKYNLPDVNARLGILQLQRLDEFIAKRHVLVEHYFDRLTGSNLTLPVRGDKGHSWNFFAPLLPLDEMSISRKALMDLLQQKGIGTGISYEAIHLTSLYRQLGYSEGDFPHAEKIGHNTLTLPLFPTLQIEEVDYVCDTLLELIHQHKR
ncbi:DegT/DnrJ/EryC1/StrS aminotransferase family protein [Ferrovum sp. PN-J185]|uniref:DegT/DnrJ/EryC1/StrS family aminotransferase n=1 Tax=Ferrovum sp. PN-J185 TaxID=1356306 RepID=UPI001E56F96C|nr:DegT/DnrJ/EryC1/StrS aminotransferase family protein [Ferrovum sp. PN-J185]MCC6068076.1 DegT/DnrJ/EryC1/StrS aminotransferase family protein [Ferrovum sp. PN-J185]